MKKCVLFDLDGTLLDTSEGIVRAVKETLDHYNLHLSENDIRDRFIGPPVEQSFLRAFNINSNQTLKEMCSFFRNAYVEKYLFNATIYQGIAKLLNDLKRKNILLGVATYKRESYTIPILHKFKINDYMDVVHGSDVDGKLSKQDIIKWCVNDLKLEISECVMVGDTIHDYNGALELGMDFIGVTYGFGIRSRDDIPSVSMVSDLYNYIMSI